MSDILDRSTDLTSDVYGINLYVNQIKRAFTPTVNEDTLMLGIFGYTGQIFSDTIQNSIVMASEFSNESIPTKAKFEKNIIAHALGLGITGINAIPATFDVLLTFIEDDIEAWYDSAKHSKGQEFPWEFTFDKDIPIYIGDYEFHTDYDILFKKVEITTSAGAKKFAYTAKYIIDIDNPVSDITNPYLTSPVKMNVNGTDVIFTKCTLRQVERQTIHKKVLSDNSISAKTVTFEFEGQLADFTIDVNEGGTVTHLIPVYEGLKVESRKYPYFYYSYLDSNTIRIKFDRYSYAPRINSDVQINLQTTKGESGNFEYDPKTYPGVSAESEKYGYSNITCEVRPVTGESSNGTDKKSIEDLKKLIPKEALSRGSITNISDLENFFNMLNTDHSILYFYKKRDNALERLYHSFIIMKDAYDVIIPTNTIDIDIEKGEVDESKKQVIKKNQCFKLVGGKGVIHNQNVICTHKDENDQFVYTQNADGSYTCPLCGETFNNLDYSENFYYIIPYNFVINTSPLYGMYFLTTIDANKFLDFSYINEDCIYQYIATSIHFYRGHNNNPNTYELSINMQQNIDDENLENANKGDAYTTRCIAVLYDENDNPLRWAEAKLINRDFDANIFSFKFEFETDDYIDIDNKIRINTGLYDIGINGDRFIAINDNKISQNVEFLSDDSGYEYPDNMPTRSSGDMVMLHNSLYEYGTDKWNEYTVAENTYLMRSENDINTLYLFSNNSWDIAPATEGNYIHINNTIYSYDGNAWNTAYSYAHLTANTKCVIHTIANQDGIGHGLNGLDKIVPNLDGYSLSNSYTVVDGIDFFYDYSDVVNSTVSVRKLQATDSDGNLLYLDAEGNQTTEAYTPGIDEKSGEEIQIANKKVYAKDENGKDREVFTIKNVPVVKYDYFDDDEGKAIDFCKELVERKSYIDYAVQVLEDAFGMDFKFFNTYGPSKLFTIDNANTYLNKTNLSLTFRVKLRANYDTNVVNDIIMDIKNYIEDINEINTIHIPNLVSNIIAKYINSIEFFEFIDMNGYGPSVQHLYSMQMPDEVIVPEFVNVMALPDGSPDINLIMV